MHGFPLAKWRISCWLCLLLLLTFTACAEPRPDRSGPQLGPQENFEAGLQDFRAGRMKAARGKLSAFIKEKGEDKNAAEALLTLGKIDLYEQDYDAATKRFHEVEQRFPTSLYTIEARHMLKVVERERKNPPPPKPKPAVEPTPDSGDSDDTELTKDTPPTLPVNEGEWLAAPYHAVSAAEFLELVETWREATLAQRPEILERLRTKADRLSQSDLEKVLEEVEDDAPLLSLVHYRLGRRQMHLHNWASAHEHFSAAKKAEPLGEAGKQAEKALARLQQRQSVKAGRVGILLPLSGRFKVFGERVKQVFDMAATEAAARSEGKLKFLYKDTAGDPIQTQKAMEELVYDEGVIAIIGPLMGDTSQAAAYQAEQLQVPLISLSPREGLPEIGPNVFRSGMTATMQAEAIVGYAWEVLGKRSFGILYPMQPYGEDLALAFWEQVRKRGGEVTAAERYEYDASTFKRQVRSMVWRYELLYGASGGGICRDNSKLTCGVVVRKFEEETVPTVDFEALFIPDYAKQVGMIAPAIPFEEVEIDNHLASTYRRMERNKRRTGHEIKAVQLLGGNGWNHERLKDFGGKWVEGGIFCDGFLDTGSPDPKSADFVAAFKKDYKRKPGTMEAYAYDAVGLLAETLLTSQAQSRKQLRAALLNLTEYQGATGSMRFDKNGEMVNELLILTLTDGVIVPAKKELNAEPIQDKTPEEVYEEFEQFDRPEGKPTN